MGGSRSKLPWMTLQLRLNPVLQAINIILCNNQLILIRQQLFCLFVFFFANNYYFESCRMYWHPIVNTLTVLAPTAPTTVLLMETMEQTHGTTRRDGHHSVSWCSCYWHTLSSVHCRGKRCIVSSLRNMKIKNFMRCSCITRSKSQNTQCAEECKDRI